MKIGIQSNRRGVVKDEGLAGSLKRGVLVFWGPTWLARTQTGFINGKLTKGL